MHSHMPRRGPAEALPKPCGILAHRVSQAPTEALSVRPRCDLGATSMRSRSARALHSGSCAFAAGVKGKGSNKNGEGTGVAASTLRSSCRALGLFANTVLQSENDNGSTAANLLARHLINEFYFCLDDIAAAAAAGDKAPPITCFRLTFICQLPITCFRATFICQVLYVARLIPWRLLAV